MTTISFGQIQIGGGPAVFMGTKSFDEGLRSIDYSLFVGYGFKKVDVGFEFIQNHYKDAGNGKKFYHFYQYQVFSRFFPFKEKTWFVKGGVNNTDEFYHFSYKSDSENITFDERGNLLGLEGGLGFQDRLIKKLDLFVNVSLTYNYLFLISDSYYFDYHHETVPFYALKLSLLYPLDFKK